MSSNVRALEAIRPRLPPAVCQDCGNQFESQLSTRSGDPPHRSRWRELDPIRKSDLGDKTRMVVNWRGPTRWRPRANPIILGCVLDW
jgi:hypothetical protein